ncbi:hypothetical protein TNCT_348341 [Trichonephila clavata]|uniref:Uncharacterized protein n=1 Tax=Trichonephila clavata TaxID=2740835 RepID=A0A8X6GVI9_TRICU|nr:hypothetical protein TNCT_348341 [Trichonephila clavata]
MEVNSDQTNGSTVFAPSVNRYHNEISLIASNVVKSLKSLEVVDKKAVRDRSERASFNKLVNGLCTRFFRQHPQMNNSNATNLKCEMHQNNMDLNLHSVQAQHHTNNGTEIVDEEAVRDRIEKLMCKVSEQTLAFMFNFLNLECNSVVEKM